MLVPDIFLHDDGVEVGLEMLTPRARDFTEQKLDTEGWQWMENILWVDHRVALDLVRLAVDSGLSVRLY